MAGTVDHELRNRIIRWHMPDAVDKFLRKNEDYGDGHNEFGAKAQVIDIGRKYKKLKDAIWDGKELQSESVVEVAQDMIGHLLLLLDEVAPVHPWGDDDFKAFQWRAMYDETFTDWDPSVHG